MARHFDLESSRVGDDAPTFVSVGTRMVACPDGAKNRRTRAPADTTCHSVISPPLNGSSKPESPVLQCWTTGSKIVGKVPPRSKPTQNTIPKRGGITKCSAGAMRRLKRFLSELDAGQSAYTFLLSYPASKAPDAAGARVHLNKLNRWIAKVFSAYGMVYKREPHLSGITHFHYLAFLGEDEELAELIAKAIMAKWCDITTGGDPEQRWFHLVGPAKAEGKGAFQKMKGESFFNYLGKYLSKDQHATAYDFEGGGKWWGKVNKDAFVFSEVTEDETSTAIIRTLFRLRESRSRRYHESRLQRVLELDQKPSDWLSMLEAAAVAQGHRPEDGRAIARHYASLKGIDLKLSKKAYWRTGSVTITGYTRPIVEALSRWGAPTVPRPLSVLLRAESQLHEGTLPLPFDSS